MAVPVDPDRRNGETNRNERPEGPATVVCACTGLTDRAIKGAIASGARTLEALQQATRVGTECGSCLPYLERLVVGASGWRRVAVERAAVADGIYQLWLTLGEGTGPSPLPGQYLRVRVRIDERWLVRAYTVTSVSTDGEVPHYEITLKRREGGAVSRWLTDRPVDELEVEISAPRGSFVWPGSSDPAMLERPAVCLVAGIGVTPALAFARYAASIRCAPGRLHIDYSVRNRSDLVALHELQAYGDARCLTLRLRITGGQHQITADDISRVAATWPSANFYVCGPTGYIAQVFQGLQLAGVSHQRILIEDFEGPLTSVTAPLDILPLAVLALVPTPRPRRPAYVAGVLAAMAALLALALPGTSRIHAKGPANTGHDTLGCADCHLPAVGTTRQQIQGRVRYLMGLRETPVHVGHVPVEDRTCTACHDNPDDRHPTHRFAEPRFDEVRRELGADRCGSCHGEHEGGRVTVDDAGFCVGCHQETEVVDDPASPTHAELIADDQWSTCLRCHDFHGNHLREAPTDLGEAVALETIERYFDGGPSPYGEERRVTAKPGGSR